MSYLSLPRSVGPRCGRDSVCCLEPERICLPEGVVPAYRREPNASPGRPVRWKVAAPATWILQKLRKGS
jgi:hypothetical protein